MSSDTSTWMPLYVADYLKDTRHLSTTEHGAYFLLLMHAWTHDGALPLDAVRLARIAGMTAKEWKESGDILLEFFRQTDGGYRHKRVDEELAKASANVEQRRAAGKASAEARKAKRNGNERSNGRSTSVATEATTEVQRNGRPSPSPIEEANASPISARERDDGPEPILLAMQAAAITHPPSAEDRRQFRAWLDAGATLDGDIIPTAKRIAARQAERGDSVQSLKYLDAAVRESRAETVRFFERGAEIRERYGHLPKPPASALGGSA